MIKNKIKILPENTDVFVIEEQLLSLQNSLHTAEFINQRVLEKVSSTLQLIENRNEFAEIFSEIKSE